MSEEHIDNSDVSEGMRGLDNFMEIESKKKIETLQNPWNLSSFR